MNFWLVKQEPSSFSFDDLIKEKKTDWTGVRNYQARNNLREMKKGDAVFFYHSGDEKQIVGLAEVSRGAFPDPTDTDWIAVEIKAKKKLSKPVKLAEIKSDERLRDIALIKNSRLSVQPLKKDEFDLILEMAK
jgi:predicted RNA-binding protein with PUA-like domain